MTTPTQPTPEAAAEDAQVIDVVGEEMNPDAPEHTATTAALVPVSVSDSALMRPVASLEDTIEAFHAYQELRAELLDRSDFQEAEKGKQFVTKSGWRKLGVAMSTSDALINWEDVEDPYGRVRRSKITVRAFAPNGRYAEGIGICDYRERCCPRAFAEPCRKGGNHRHCDETCTGFSHFSKPQHDIPSTAHTRAKNRALSDLFGFGEVSAEEVSGAPDATGGRDTSQDNEPASGEHVAAITAAMNSIEDKGQRRGVKLSYVSRFGQPHELKQGDVEAAIRLVTAAGGKVANVPEGSGPAAAAGASPTDAPSDGGSNGSGEVAATGERVGTRETPAAPPESSAADVPGSQVPGDEAADTGPPAVPVVPAPGTAAAPTPEKPSTAAQRQRIGMRVAELAKLSLLKQGDKPEIVAILTGERATSTTEMTSDEANRMISLLAFLEAGDLEMSDDPDDASGGRVIATITQRGRDFLGPVLAAFAPPVQQSEVI